MNAEFKQVESINEFIDAIRLRVEVFIKEQGFLPGWEPDEDDKVSKSFIALVKGEVVATARFRESSPGEIKIERMACKKELRKKGICKGLLKFMLQEIKKTKPKRIWAKSQEQAQEFYEKNGFKKVTEAYEEYGVEHVDMEYGGQKTEFTQA